MSIVVQKGRKYLCADALFRLLREHFATIADDRVDEVEIPLSDALMSAFAMFSLKAPSLLAFDKQRAEGNLQTIYGITHTPCDTRRRERLDPVSPESLRPSFTLVFRQLQRGKALEPMAFLDGHYLLALDGTGYFPPRRFTVRRACTRSTATGRSPIITRCWAPRLSIRTFVK